MAISQKQRKHVERASKAHPLELNPRKRGPAPEWLPDWRDDTQYPLPKHLLFLAWQFIRRNPDYWKDWHRFSSLPKHTLEDLDGFDWSTGQYHPVGSVFYDMCFYQTAEGAPDALSGETRQKYVRRTGSEPTPVCDWIEKKWGFHPLADPSVQVQRMTHRADVAEAVPPHFGREAVKQFEANPSKFMIVAIDTNRSIDAQIDISRKMALALRTRFKSLFGGERPILQSKTGTTRVRARELLLYLRAYDAAWTGAKDADIAVALSLAAVRDVQRYIRAAQRYIGGEYRSLLSAI